MKSGVLFNCFSCEEKRIESEVCKMTTFQFSSCRGFVWARLYVKPSTGSVSPQFIKIFFKVLQ